MLQKKIKKGKIMNFFLTIAASDSSGGAGIQQDLKMAQRTGFWGLSAVTAITSQDFHNVYIIEFLKEKVIETQLKNIFKSFKISAIKIGVLPSIRFAKIISQYLNSVDCPKVYDPVYKSSSGHCLLTDEPKEIFQIISPHCTVITPNIPEFEFYYDTDIKSALKNFKGKPNIYLKGGHSTENKIIEYLFYKNTLKHFAYERSNWVYNKGTGCAFSSLLSMYLVDNEIEIACQKARRDLVQFYDETNINLHHIIFATYGSLAKII